MNDTPETVELTAAEALADTITAAIAVFSAANPDADLDSLDIAQALAIVGYGFLVEPDGDDSEDTEG
jgi:hypothetical protein